MKNMRSNILLLATLICFNCVIYVSGSENVRISNLRCEYLKNPLGIDETHPRLSWILKSDERGQKQTAYRLLVAGSKENLANNIGDLWDSGKVSTNQSIHIVYQGKPLNSRLKCYWKVMVWDRDGKSSDWSEPATWRMGLLHDMDWNAKWIGGEREKPKERKKRKFYKDAPLWDPVGRTKKAVYLRRKFDIDKKIHNAEVSVCGLGFYRLFINGKEVSEDKLNPAPSDYGKRVLYQTYDVTTLLNEGGNVVSAILGNGWYNMVSRHTLWFHKADWIAPPKLIMNMQVELEDGTHVDITTDEEWKFSHGPIKYNCVLGGMTYDARKEMPGWGKTGFDDSKWRNVYIMPPPEGKLKSQLLPPVRAEKIKPAKIEEPYRREYRIDTGRDTAGVAGIRVRAKRNRAITLEYPGARSHSGERYQVDKYICRGDDEEVFIPFFTYHGFRYVDVFGLKYEPKLEDFDIVELHTHFTPAGSFECSNPDMNFLQEVTRRTALNYVRHLPQDPVREKAGWTEDVWTMFDAMAFNFESALMYRNWQREFIVSQLPDGLVPPVAPGAGWLSPVGKFNELNGPWWGGMILITPWKLYQYYGDREILEESYIAMARFMDNMGARAKNYILEWSLGDWGEVGSTGLPIRTPSALTGTGAYFYYAGIMSKVAAILDKKDDINKYSQLADKIADALNKKFLDKDTGCYIKDSQGAQVMALWLGYAPETMRDKIHQLLIDDIRAKNYHLSTGFVTTTMLVEYLTRTEPQLFYRLVMQKDAPGFLAMAEKGSFYEFWNGAGVQMPSLGGPIGTYFYEGILGIQKEPDVPAFKKFIIKPGSNSELTWAKGYHISPYGKIDIQWENIEKGFSLKVTIPVNTTATVYVPAKGLSDVRENNQPVEKALGVKFLRMENGKVVLGVDSGTYHFTSKL